jgi:hypothetical protein
MKKNKVSRKRLKMGKADPNWNKKYWKAICKKMGFCDY